MYLGLNTLPVAPWQLACPIVKEALSYLPKAQLQLLATTLENMCGNPLSLDILWSNLHEITGPDTP